MRRITLLFGTICLLSLKALGQIQGDVIDQKDKGVPNAFIIATDTTRKIVDTVKSDSRGFYEFKNLKPGKYKIEVKANGFKPTVIENIVVKEGDVGIFEVDLYRGQRLDITLTPAKIP
jgi:hypothetical protein